jgi:hypothetical protein
VNQRWIKQAKGTYDFDVTKADKLLEFLVKEGRIKLPKRHSMLRPNGVKEKRYCGFHERNSHSINDCRVFRMRIHKAIQEGHLKFDNKMKLDGHPFPQNMVVFSVNMVTTEEKGKVKVLTSARAKKDRSVDPTRQVTVKAHRRELEEHAREQERAHWGCAFFRHCWNEGLKLPTLNNCPECSDKYTEYRQDTINRRSVHERIGRIHPSAVDV